MSRVLVIEDYEESRDALEEILRIWGHDVMAAGDGLDGLALARGFRPHAVILDIGLPDIDGWRVAEELLSAAAPPVLIGLTGWSDPGDQARAEAAGFAALFVKPCDVLDLGKALDAALRRRGQAAAG